MEDLEVLMREDLERSSDNRTSTSDRSQPSVQLQPTQSSRLLEPVETAQPSDSARDTKHRPSYLSEVVSPSASVTVSSTPIAPVACAGAGTIPYPSTKPYQVMVEKPVSLKSNVVEPEALTNNTGASTRCASRPASKNPHVKTSKKPENRTSEVFTPVASTSSDCAGASSALTGCREPYVVIVEQPKPGRRFRYNTEITSAGAIHGVKCTCKTCARNTCARNTCTSRRESQRQSFPKIKIGNYTGVANITVSLVCEDEPHRLHPNGIVGKNKLLEEVYVKKVLVTRDNCVIQFDDLGIWFVKLNQIEEVLQLRKAQGIDPYKQGYKFSPESYDLQAVRLCFQVSLVTQQLEPVVSNVIYHWKKFGCLNIKRMSVCRGNKSGGPDIIFLSKELNPNDLEVVFYEEENGVPVWEECVRIFEVYGRSAIVCAAPAYTRPGVPGDTEVTVSVALRRRWDRERGEPRTFTYSADDAEVLMKKRKMIRSEIQKIPINWTPNDSLPPDNESLYDQDWQNLPLPFYFNQPMPEPNFANPGMLEPNFDNPTMPGLLDSNSVIPSKSTNPAMLGPISVTLAVSGPNHVTPAEPGLNSINAFLPGPNIPLSPDMDPMSFTEDTGVLSPNWYLDEDGGIPSVDTVLAEACAKL